MSIARACKIGGILCLACILVLAVCAVHVQKTTSAMQAFDRMRFNSVLLALEARDTSASLTAHARAYVSTGDPRYEAAYWELVRVRAGELPRPHGSAVAPGRRIAVQDLMEETGFTPEEMDILSQSVALSQALVAIEDEAMHAVKGSFKDLQGEFSITGQPDFVRARQLMFSDAYREAVDNIMAPTHAFEQRVSDRLNVTGQELQASMDLALIVLFVLLAVLGACVLVSVMLLKRRIVLPVGRGAAYAAEVAAGNLDAQPPTDLSGNEVGSLVRAMEAMVRHLKERILLSERKTAEAEDSGRQAAAAMQQALKAKVAAEAGQRAILHMAERVERFVSSLLEATEKLDSLVAQSLAGAEIQRQRVASSATAMEEMNATVSEVARNAGVAANSSERAREKAVQGEAVVQQAMESITAVQDDTRALQRGMEELDRCTAAIGDILNLISEIADQTNLLALNAAIEAARAVDAGRGFAVVADEVRKLAEKTMHATRDVDATVRSIQGHTRHSIKAMERTVLNLEETTALAVRSGTSLEEIVHEVMETAQQISGIASAAAQQSASSEEINRSLEEINHLAEDSAGTVQQASEAVSSLAAQSRELQVLVEELRHQG